MQRKQTNYTMIEVNPNNRPELIFKALALSGGILIGCLYASLELSVQRQWFSSPSTDTQTTPSPPVIELNETARFLVADDTTVADNLKSTIRILCWLRKNEHSLEQIEAIKRTWAARCTNFIVITNSGENSTDVFNIQTDQNRSYDIESAYRFLNENFADKYDWFLKTNGYSYFVLENLRYALFAYDPSTGVGVGLPKNDTKTSATYFSDVAGYVLSRRALGMLVDGFTTGSNCTNAKGNIKDEVRVGICLKEMGVHFGSGTNQFGQQLFFDTNLHEFLLPEENVEVPHPWYQEYEVDHFLDHASNYSIAFCCITSKQMFVMEFLIYHLRLYGVETVHPDLPEKERFD